jgi:high-affinity iron transporter
MIFWMASAARGLAGELRGQVDQAVEFGGWSLVLVGMLAVGREGLETALFLWAATNAVTAGGGGAALPLLGAALGIATAVALAYLLYRGALKINLSRFFTWTGAFLVVIAAGVLAYGIHDLQEAGLLPGEDTLLFDVSGTIKPASWYAELLRGVFNFRPAMSVLEGLGWLLYVVPVMTLFLRKALSRPPSSTAQRPAVPEKTA